MAKGENIFKRKDGRWEARYIKGYELSGKIKYGFCYGKTYREAKEKVTQARPQWRTEPQFQQRSPAIAFHFSVMRGSLPGKSGSRNPLV